MRWNSFQILQTLAAAHVLSHLRLIGLRKLVAVPPGALWPGPDSRGGEEASDASGASASGLPKAHHPLRPQHLQAALVLHPGQEICSPQQGDLICLGKGAGSHACHERSLYSEVASV